MREWMAALLAVSFVGCADHHTGARHSEPQLSATAKRMLKLSPILGTYYVQAEGMQTMNCNLFAGTPLNDRRTKALCYAYTLAVQQTQTLTAESLSSSFSFEVYDDSDTGTTSEEVGLYANFGTCELARSVLDAAYVGTRRCDTPELISITQAAKSAREKNSGTHQ